jgi:possible competence protein F
MAEWERWKEGILNAVFPRRCILCDEVLEEEGAFCSSCGKKEPLTGEPACIRCGRGILRDEESLCKNCKEHHFSFQGGMILYQLSEEVEDAIAELKYKGRKDKGIFFGKRAGEIFCKKLQALSIDGIFPVPIHRDRRKKRGYNQAEVIGEALAKECDIPIYSAYLMRDKKTKALKELNPMERMQNLLSAMACENLPKEVKKVLLVDDIFTTGATMEACARKLLEKGAEEVYILAIAARADR